MEKANRNELSRLHDRPIRFPLNLTAVEGKRDKQGAQVRALEPGVARYSVGREPGRIYNHAGDLRKWQSGNFHYFGHHRC